MKRFEISGYWKDDRSEFSGYIVQDTEDVLEDDDSIFYYGLSENDLKEAIKEGENNALDFVVTEYREISV